jgi:hypothetical protein
LSPQSWLPIDAGGRLSPRLPRRPAAAPRVPNPAVAPAGRRRASIRTARAKAVAFGGHERAGQHCDHAAPAELPKIVRQIADRLVIRRVAEFFQHRSRGFSPSAASRQACRPAGAKPAASIRRGRRQTNRPGVVSSTASRSAASSSTRPACFAVAAAAESASRCRQAPAHRSCRRTTASSAPMAAPAESARSSRSFPARLCASGMARRSQAGTVCRRQRSGAGERAVWRGEDLGRRIIASTMNHGGAFCKPQCTKPPRLSVAHNER